VTLQNGASWTLTYDSWGFLQTVTSPTGAVMTYAYYPPSSQYPANQSTGQRYLESRSLNVNGATSPWSYAYSTTSAPGNETNFQTIVTDPLGNTVTHIFNENGTESQTLYKQGTAQTPLKTMQYTFVTLGLRAYLPKQTTTIYPNGQSTTTCVIYDNNTNTTCTGTDAFSPGGLTVYDPNDKLRGIPGFIPYSAPLVLGSPMYSYVYDYTGVLLSETANTYQWQANDSYRAANLLNLVSSSSISAGGTALSTKTRAYDEAAYGPVGIFGNATTEVDGGSITTHAFYNTSGMTTGTQDGNGNTTTIVYDSTGAYPKTVTRPPANGVAHVDNYVYDGNTGLMTSHTDENQKTTTYTYDSIRRPK
jgi:YD repeat-containing protein